MTKAKLVLIGNDCGMYKYIKSPYGAHVHATALDQAVEPDCLDDDKHRVRGDLEFFWKKMPIGKYVVFDITSSDDVFLSTKI